QVRTRQLPPDRCGLVQPLDESPHRAQQPAGGGESFCMNDIRTFPHAPSPPDWAVDWDAIARRFAWIQALAGVPQEAAYHAEGDVLVHTRMVAESLAALDEWRVLGPEERGPPFAAARPPEVA